MLTPVNGRGRATRDFRFGTGVLGLTTDLHSNDRIDGEARNKIGRYAG